MRKNQLLFLWIQQSVALECTWHQTDSFFHQLSWTPNVPEIFIGDPGLLYQLLLNLVSNGVKFTNSGYVHVTVSLKNTSLNPKEFHVQFVVSHFLELHFFFLSEKKCKNVDPLRRNQSKKMLRNWTSPENVGYQTLQKVEIFGHFMNCINQHFF